MTERIGYFVARTDRDPERVALACRMMRRVGAALVTPDGDVLGLLSTRLRDDPDEFGVLARAVGAIAGVVAVDGHAYPMDFKPEHSPHEGLVAEVEAAIAGTRPQCPADIRDLGVFARETTAWMRTADALRDTLREMPRKEPRRP